MQTFTKLEFFLVTMVVVLSFTIALVLEKVLEKTIPFKAIEQPLVSINIFETGVKNISVVDRHIVMARAITREIKMHYPFYIKA
ncbi:hypothetical protein GCM10011506_17680 [Marivirga lumbricoides]|uniref:Uncharacterized protein n=1 Tax=Marivirga lumbricoides TaxID=1046115 RepID=A0ABQ1M3U9_9BACT|nr:hypothetical protein GCM10011506_17680 [Marivirga lumbricoides]